MERKSISQDNFYISSLGDGEVSTEMENPGGGKGEWRKVNDCHKQRGDGETMQVDAVI